MKHMSGNEKILYWANFTFLTFTSLLCLAPLIHVLAISFSSSHAAAAGSVFFWPVNFTLSSYTFVFGKNEFLTAGVISFQRVILGTFINMLLTIMIAYPLSKEVSQFRMRTIYVWYFVITILFSGGLIPLFMTVKMTGLIDTIWALILPGAVPVFNVVLLLNFFRNLPNALEESAKIDGAGQWLILWRIYLPLSMPALATITLFAMVGHWNSWFDGLIFMNRPENYPLQSYLQTIVIQRDLSFLSPEDLLAISEISERTTKAAQIFVALLPILLVYPFLQKYFVKGIVLGSVKE